ncbi:CubicO group peptidase (beta-lactamase class C family) [Stella humosa]|uniref:CubicO group peptidase (Beta-lactamase class C family) n=1 Tax=Stella humosa TaxID=94 RepID=A0A3N1MFB9_9PROT|nr:serine hydrolase domain-containing protein [Stella humosa]ROQ01825.1 CubicO group peptidase (beta-lactamase class C family) [Stella humosa]BBK32212.1 hypothetical protein STHU_28460 [Stella humosa]
MSAPPIDQVAIDQAALDRLVAIAADEPGIAAAAIVGGRVAWRHCAGLASLSQGTPIDAYTRFHLVSLSKPFTAATMVAAAAAGRLSLDDDIRRHLPEMPAPDHGRPVTVRHLLSMTSGLDDVLEIDRLRGIWHPAPGRAADLLALALARGRTSAPPGRRYMYGNVNFVLADEILRRLGHDSADAARCAAVYDPLGLSRTVDRHHDGIPLPGLAEPYVLDGGRWRRATDILGICGDPVTSTLNDLCCWATALLAGAVPALDEMARPTTLASGQPLRYGLGLFLRAWRGHRVIGHFGTQPGYKAGMALLPEQGIGIVFLSNREDRTPGQMVPAMLDILLPTAPSAMPLPQGRDGEYACPDSGEWVRVAGGVLDTVGSSYRIAATGDGFRGVEDLGAMIHADGRFQADGTLDLDLGGEPMVLAPVVPGAFDPGDYAGAYDGVDIASRHVVHVAGGGLEISYGTGGDRGRRFVMRPLGRDLFLVEPAAPGIAHRHTFRFRRDADGRVTGAVATLERLKRIALRRAG